MSGCKEMNVISSFPKSWTEFNRSLQARVPNHFVWEMKIDSSIIVIIVDTRIPHPHLHQKWTSMNLKSCHTFHIISEQIGAYEFPRNKLLRTKWKWQWEFVEKKAAAATIAAAVHSFPCSTGKWLFTHTHTRMDASYTFAEICAIWNAKWRKCSCSVVRLVTGIHHSQWLGCALCTNAVRVYHLPKLRDDEQCERQHRFIPFQNAELVLVSRLAAAHEITSQSESVNEIWLHEWRRKRSRYIWYSLFVIGGLITLRNAIRLSIIIVVITRSYMNTAMWHMRSKNRSATPIPSNRLQYASRNPIRTPAKFVNYS